LREWLIVRRLVLFYDLLINLFIYSFFSLVPLLIASLVGF